MKEYFAYGIKDFAVYCGYKGYVIKEHLTNYFLDMSDLILDMQNNKMEVHQHNAELWINYVELLSIRQRYC